MNKRNPRKARPATGRERPRDAPRGGRHAAPPAAPEATQKLQKVLAQSGLGSRRDMELLISGETQSLDTCGEEEQFPRHTQLLAASLVAHWM